MSEPPRPVNVVSVVPLNDLHLQLDFDDGLSRTVDVTPYVQEAAFKQIRLSEKFFKTAHVENGTVVWDNGVMLDADLLRYGPPKPPKPEKAKPAVKPAKAAKPVTKAVKAKAKPAKSKPAAKTVTKKTVKAVKPVKKAKPAAKPTKTKAAAKPAKKPAKKKR